MSSIAEMIVSHAKISRNYAEVLAKDIPASRFARRPVGRNGEAVVTNTPAFVFGHLALYPSRCLQVASRPADELAVPAAWEALFAPSAVCQDDPSGTIYPGKDELVTALLDRHTRLMAMLPSIPDGVMLSGNPIERYRERFPLVGGAIGFLMSGHMMLHLGQVSAWRRFEGMPSAM